MCDLCEGRPEFAPGVIVPHLNLDGISSTALACLWPIKIDSAPGKVGNIKGIRGESKHKGPPSQQGQERAS